MLTCVTVACLSFIEARPDSEVPNNVNSVKEKTFYLCKAKNPKHSQDSDYFRGCVRNALHCIIAHCSFQMH